MQIMPITVQSDVPPPQCWPLRVLLVARTLKYTAGVPRCLLYLASAADRARVDLWVASMVEPTAQMVQEFANVGVRTHWVGDTRYLRPAARVRDLIDTHGADVVVATCVKTFL